MGRTRATRETTRICRFPAEFTPVTFIGTSGAVRVRVLRQRGGRSMSVRQKTAIYLLSWAACLAAASMAHAQTGPETFTATASVKTAGKAAATAPVTITIDRKMSESE